MPVKAHFDWLPAEPEHIRPDPCNDKTQPTQVRPSPSPPRELCIRSSLQGHCWYLFSTPPTGRVWHKVFQVGPGAGPLPKHARHSPKKARLGRQVMNLALPRMVRTWGDGLRRLEDACQGATQPTATETRTHPIRSAHRQSMANQSASQPSAPPPESSVYAPLCWEIVSPRVNRVSINEGGRVHYRVDRPQ